MDWLFEHDTALKILAVVVAVAVWVQVNVSNPPSVERSPEAAVAWIAPGTASLHVMTPRPGGVTVVIKGPPSAVGGTPAAYVNLSKINHAGTYRLPVQATVPAGTSLVRVVPSFVSVTVIQFVAKSFAIKLESTGALPAGYGVETMALANSHVLVRGSSTAVSQVTAVVARVALNGQTASFSSQATLLAVNRAGNPVKGVTLSPTSRLANVTVSPEKVVSVTAKYSGKPAAGYSIGTIAVSPLHVTLYGPASVLSGISTVYTNPVSIAGASSQVTTPSASLALPAGVTQAVPPSVSVTINIQ